jgi:bifunctional non-homologous end joining protein LigD
LLRYLTVISPYFLEFFRDRPIAFVRTPEGIDGERFYQKHFDKGQPEFVQTVPIYSSSNDRTTNYVMVNNLTTMLWLAQLGTTEFHPWYSRINPEPDARDKHLRTGGSEEDIDSSILAYPDFMVVDLDPYIYAGHEKAGAEPELNKTAFKVGVEVAHRVREMLHQLGLECWVKTSGKTGLHLYVPIVREFHQDAVKALCETFGRQLLQQMPDKVTMEWQTVKRVGKVFYDHNQNVMGKTLCGAYSPRPSHGAPVSFPVDFEELDSIYPPDFNLFTAPELLKQRGGDRWAGILGRKQSLASLLGS